MNYAELIELVNITVCKKVYNRVSALGEVQRIKIVRQKETVFTNFYKFLQQEFSTTPISTRKSTSV